MNICLCSFPSENKVRKNQGIQQVPLADAKIETYNLLNRRINNADTNPHIQL